MRTISYDMAWIKKFLNIFSIKNSILPFSIGTRCKVPIGLSFILISLLFIVLMPGVIGEKNYVGPTPGIVQFTLTNLPEGSEVLRTSLMKVGSNSKDGRAHQILNTSFIRSMNTILWTPCDENSCSYASFPTSGGNNGPDELILEIILKNAGIDTQSCYGDTTCERLKGAISTKSGILDGIFKTGRSYEISVSSQGSGIGKTFKVNELS